MGKTAFVFTGQGAQYSGMGRYLYENSPAAKAIFDIADSLRPGISEMCFSGSSDMLSMTVNTQPALYTVDLASAAMLNENGITADMTAGFSLGELAANAYAGAFSFEEGFRLVCKRAELMTKCAETTKGVMVAVLKLSDEKTEELAAKFNHVYPANYNSPGQVTVACSCDEYESFLKLVGENGGKAMKLAVSGAFHSPLMREAADLFADVLEGVQISRSRIPVYSNVTARPYDGDYKKLIARQIMSPVKWEETVMNMIADGVRVFVEAGAGKVLSGLIKRISAETAVYHTDKLEDMHNTVLYLKGNETNDAEK